MAPKANLILVWLCYMKPLLTPYNSDCVLSCLQDSHFLINSCNLNSTTNISGDNQPMCYQKYI